MAKNNDPLAALKEANVSSQFINNIIAKLDTPQAQSLLNIMGIDKNFAEQTLKDAASSDASGSQVIQDSDIERLRNGLKNL